MDHWFDTLARSVANKQTRRTFLLRGSPALVGVLLPFLLPRQALAVPPPKPAGQGPCPAGTEHCRDQECCPSDQFCGAPPKKQCLCRTTSQPPC